MTPYGEVDPTMERPYHSDTDWWELCYQGGDLVTASSSEHGCQITEAPTPNVLYDLRMYRLFPKRCTPRPRPRLKTEDIFWLMQFFTGRLHG